jgi:hypothetical protein
MKGDDLVIRLTTTSFPGTTLVMGLSCQLKNYVYNWNLDVYDALERECLCNVE